VPVETEMRTREGEKAKRASERASEKEREREREGEREREREREREGGREKKKGRMKTKGRQVWNPERKGAREWESMRLLIMSNINKNVQ